MLNYNPPQGYFYPYYLLGWGVRGCTWQSNQWLDTMTTNFIKGYRSINWVAEVVRCIHIKIWYSASYILLDWKSTRTWLENVIQTKMELLRLYCLVAFSCYLFHQLVAQVIKEKVERKIGRLGNNVLVFKIRVFTNDLEIVEGSDYLLSCIKWSSSCSFYDLAQQIGDTYFAACIMYFRNYPESCLKKYWFCIKHQLHS